MILSFGSRDTRKIWEGEWATRFSGELQQVIRRKLRMLNRSQNMRDLMTPPSNRLEKLKGTLYNDKVIPVINPNVFFVKIDDEKGENLKISSNSF